MLMNKFLLIKK